MSERSENVATWPLEAALCVLGMHSMEKLGVGPPAGWVLEEPDGTRLPLDSEGEVCVLLLAYSLLVSVSISGSVWLWSPCWSRTHCVDPAGLGFSVIARAGVFNLRSQHLWVSKDSFTGSHIRHPVYQIFMIHDGSNITVMK